MRPAHRRLIIRRTAAGFERTAWRPPPAGISGHRGVVATIDGSTRVTTVFMDGSSVAIPVVNPTLVSGTVGQLCTLFVSGNQPVIQSIDA